jgi:hypothetical protein
MVSQKPHSEKAKHRRLPKVRICTPFEKAMEGFLAVKPPKKAEKKKRK